MSIYLDQLLTLPQHIVPQHLLSRLARRLSSIQQPTIKNFLIRRFLAAYDINLEEASSSSIEDYAHFNAFFTRQLKPDARPLPQDSRSVCSPADGRLSQFGSIKHGQLIQAKGRHFNLHSFLAAPTNEVARYATGSFATIYLAPNDYHRVHVPFDGKIVSAKFVPGKLFSVNQRTARTVDQLFARNERVVVEIDTEHFGRIAVVLVGAMLVASIGLEFFDMESAIYGTQHSTVPANVPAYINGALNLPIDLEKMPLLRGEGLGWFNMGSTVILVFEQDRFEFQPSLALGQQLRMGEVLGSVK